MATSMVEVKTDQLTDILEHLHPLIAKCRTRELDTDPKVLRAMPFNGDHVSALREALEDIASGGKVDIKNLTSRLMSRSWPDEAFFILQSVLEAAAPITDDELRNVCLRSLNKNTAKVFNNSTPFNNLMAYQDVGDQLAEYFAGSKRDERKLLKIIDGMIKHSNTKDLRMSQFAKIRREALYFHMIANNPTGYQPAYHDSDVLNLTKRCESHVARYAVSLIKAQPKPSPQLRQVIRCMENGPVTMDSDYIIELYTLIRPLDAKDATTLFKAVNEVCTRLHSLPRHIARNYWMALKRGGWGYAKGAKSEVTTAIYRAVDKATVQPILEDLNRPCSSNFTGAHRMIPSSLFDANVDLLIDLNHALMAYLEEKGWTREGEMIYHIAS
ncbi:hypothetical protein PG996_003310 [Apiospora saccharicola]|uniref:Uncharacterized protein n=1 Tax=Apiospora saccharicola TaxID=335842 RepID=A0ABR1W0W0_9PEZI